MGLPQIFREVWLKEDAGLAAAALPVQEAYARLARPY